MEKGKKYIPCSYFKQGKNVLHRVILDTDLGDDIDDMWALAFLLRCPEIRLELIVTAGHGFHDIRARIAARLLIEAGGVRGMKIGLGCINDLPQERHMYQESWVRNLNLKEWQSSYSGEVISDGVQALIDIVMSSDDIITVIAIGPMDNILEALKREPRIVSRVRFVSMLGSINVGYLGIPIPMPEFNVKVNPKAVRTVLSAQWIEKIITPLDSCGSVAISGDVWQAFKASKDPLAKTLIKAHTAWYNAVPEKVRAFRRYPDPSNGTTILYDTVAVHLTFSNWLFEIQKLHLQITDDGMTKAVDSTVSEALVDVAIRCEDVEAFVSYMVSRLTSGGNYKSKF